MEPIENKKEEIKPVVKMDLKPEIKVEPKIKFDDFAKIEIKIGKILTAEKVPATDKLLKLAVDFGLKPFVATNGSPEKDIRQVVSGIALFFPDITKLIGKKCAFATNLEPRIIKGLESNGMILAGKSENTFSLLEVSPDLPEGTKIS